MARKKSFLDRCIEGTISALQLSEIKVLAHDPNAVVCVRQCDGTDFPPYIAIENKEQHNRLNKENQYKNLLID